MPSARLRGSCKAIFALNVARSIDLQRAESSSSWRRTHFRHKSRVPEGSAMSPPLRFPWTLAPERVGDWSTAPELEIAAYDSGALCITWELPFEATLEELVALSATLYEHPALTARSRELAEELTQRLGAALDRPRLAQHVEDYVVFEVQPEPGRAAELLARSRATLARLLRAEDAPLSAQEVDDALARPVSYASEDLCLVDWLAALLVGEQTDDERLVLELATVELLELRRLDDHLQREIEEAYALLTRRRTLWSAFTIQRRELEQLARIQADDALLHEGIDNALKLFGDDYLARLYRTSAARFHFEDWDLSIQRKLGVLRSVYGSLADLASHRRSELLEWIIIVLIAADILLYFTPLRG